MKWALKNPNRFLLEQEEIVRLAAEVPWLKPIGWRLGNELAIEVELDMVIHDQIYPIKLTYPDFFPDTPAYICPRDKSERWTSHQYGPGGSLCLEWRADNWQPNVTGAELVRSAHRLLSREKNPEKPTQVLSAHDLTQGQEIRSTNQRLVITAALFKALSAISMGTGMQIETGTLFHNSSTDRITSTVFITGIGETSETMTSINDVPKALSSYLPLFLFKGDGYAIKSDSFENKAPIHSVEDLGIIVERARLSKTISFLRNPESKKLGDTVVLLINDQPGSWRAFGVNEGKLSDYAVILPHKEEFSRLSLEYEQLKEKRIGIVGMGSMGSKVAISLARSGIRKFLLVDDDIFMPENICRNELSWAAVGMHKADAVQEALSLIAPNIDITVRIHRIGGQESSISAAAVLKELASCEIIVDATASPTVFLRIAAVAKEKRRAVCWGEVFAGGIGGMIARARPDLDPNPLAARNAITTFYESLPPAPYKEAIDYGTGIDQPIVADDADVTHIASALTRLVIDTALCREPSAFPYSAYLIGLRADWVFKQPFDTQPIILNGQGWNEEDNTGTNDQQEAVARILFQMLELADDGPGPSGAPAQDNHSSSS